MKTNIVLPDNLTPAYDEVFLGNMILAHQDGYMLFNKLEDYNTASLIDSYMRTSNCRSGMDNGGTRWLGFAGGGTIVSYTDKSQCKRGNEKMDDDVLDWIAEAYTVFQWMYNLKSKDISEVLPAKRMEALHAELSQYPISVVCEKLCGIYEAEHADKDITEEEGET